MSNTNSEENKWISLQFLSSTFPAQKFTNIQILSLNIGACVPISFPALWIPWNLEKADVIFHEGNIWLEIINAIIKGERSAFDRMKNSKLRMFVWSAKEIRRRRKQTIKIFQTGVNQNVAFRMQQLPLQHSRPRLVPNIKMNYALMVELLLKEYILTIILSCLSKQHSNWAENLTAELRFQVFYSSLRFSATTKTFF